MAEQQSSYEVVAVASKDILAERQRSWDGFTQFVTWGIGLTIALLVALAVFVV